jgi:hypothetical protein
MNLITTYIKYNIFSHDCMPFSSVNDHHRIVELKLAEWYLIIFVLSKKKLSSSYDKF